MDADYDKYGTLFDNSPSSPEDADLLALLQQYSDQGRLPELFQPFQQEQSVLDQQMALAQQMRQGGPRRATPMGALLGGLSDAFGNVGGAVLQQKGLGEQKALGKRMQGDAAGRTDAVIQLLRKKQQPAGSMGLLPTMSDTDLVALMGG